MVQEAAERLIEGCHVQAGISVAGSSVFYTITLYFCIVYLIFFLSKL